MSKILLTRFTWTDDSGGGTNGTVINNAELQKIFNEVDAAIGQVVKVKTAAYTALVTDDLIKATSGTWTLTLYTAVGNDGKALAVVNLGAGTVTLDGNAAETINGGTTFDLRSNESCVIQSDGANWVIVADYNSGMDIIQLEALS